MKKQTKTLLASMIAGYFALTGAVIADNDVSTTKIEIRAEKEELTTIKVNTDDVVETIELTPEELADDVLLEARLAGLDDKTRETVMQALAGTRHIVDGEMDLTHFAKLADGDNHKMFVINAGEGHVVHATEDMDFTFETASDLGTKVIRKHFVFGDDEDGVLRGHSSAIVKMIEKGEFSQEELDEIQAALDSKR